MVKDIHVLLLGFETQNGQLIIKRIFDYFPTLKVAVPAGMYGDNITMSQYILPINYSDVEQMTHSFQFVQTVVACDSKYNTLKIKQAAEAANVKFLDVCYNYPKTVVESAYYKFSFTPTQMNAHQSASGVGIRGLWILSHQKSMLSFPALIEEKWSIKQEPINVHQLKVNHFIEFSNRFFAYLFWLLALLFRIIFPFFKDRQTYSSNCNWRFFGETTEHSTKYKFIATANDVEADLLRPDEAILSILNSLGFKENEIADWNCFNRFRIKLQKYELEK